MRKLFRGKLLDFFAQAVKQGSITLCGELASYSDEQTMKALLSSLYQKDWTVYAKAPFASAEALVKYLGSYTHRVAISDSRIVDASDTSVSFTYKDYACDGQRKTMTLTPGEFVRRFLLHVLPQGFKKIRYFGFLAPRAKEKRLNRCRLFFGKTLHKPKKGSKPWYQIVKERTGKDPRLCPVCKIGILLPLASLLRPTLAVATG
jgi:hypothetical protein